MNSSPSIMTLSTYRSGYDPCTVILISSAPARAITPSHISGASRPLDNLMMQGSLPSLDFHPPPPSPFFFCRALISPCSFRLISAEAHGCSLQGPPPPLSDHISSPLHLCVARGRCPGPLCICLRFGAQPLQAPEETQPSLFRPCSSSPCELQLYFIVISTLSSLAWV